MIPKAKGPTCWRRRRVARVIAHLLGLSTACSQYALFRMQINTRLEYREIRVESTQKYASLAFELPSRNREIRTYMFRVKTNTLQSTEKYAGHCALYTNH